MSIYVDNLAEYSESIIAPAARRHGNAWCHMWCDAGEEDALHALSVRIGLKKRWYQDAGKRWPHYDLVASKRKAAVRAGAIEMQWRDWYKARIVRKEPPPVVNGGQHAQLGLSL